MTGPEHFREGERLLAEAEQTQPLDRRADCRQRAVAHFAAATAAFTAARLYGVAPDEYPPN